MKDIELQILEDSITPGKLLHRQEEKEKLQNYIETSTDHEVSSSVFLEGESGSGKTALGKKILEESKLNGAYVNCWHYRSRHKLLKKIAESFESKFTTLHSAGGADQLYDLLQDSISAPKIVVLDEIGKLENLEPLYDLYELKPVTLVLITRNRSIVLEDDTLDSRIQAVGHISLDKYKDSELSDIVREVASEALIGNSYSQDALAKIVSQSDGDTRKALEMLKQAYLDSEISDNGRKIEESDIEDIDGVKTEEMSLSLNRDQEVLFDIVKEEERIRPRSLYNQYNDEVEDPKVDRTLRKYLKEMENANLVEAEGSGRWKIYSVASA